MSAHKDDGSESGFTMDDIARRFLRAPPSPDRPSKPKKKQARKRARKARRTPARPS